MEKFPPRQHNMGLIFLTMVQLAQTSKKITKVGKNCALQQTERTCRTIPTATTDKGVPRQHHMDLLCLNIVRPA